MMSPCSSPKSFPHRQHHHRSRASAGKTVVVTPTRKKGPLYPFDIADAPPHCADDDMPSLADASSLESSSTAFGVTGSDHHHRHRHVYVLDHRDHDHDDDHDSTAHLLNTPAGSRSMVSSGGETVSLFDRTFDEEDESDDGSSSSREGEECDFVGADVPHLPPPPLPNVLSWSQQQGRSSGSRDWSHNSLLAATSSRSLASNKSSRSTAVEKDGSSVVSGNGERLILRSDTAELLDAEQRNGGRANLVKMCSDVNDEMAFAKQYMNVLFCGMGEVLDCNNDRR